MDAKTKSMICGAVFVIGLALSLVGLCRITFNQPVSENDAIQNAARVTQGPNGQRMYSITDAEIRQADRQRQTTNSVRAQARQSGKSLALPGVIMLVVALIGFGTFRAKKTVADNAFEDRVFQ